MSLRLLQLPAAMAVAAAMLLTGCVPVVAAPEHEVTPSDLDAFRANSNDSWWESFSLPDALRPDPLPIVVATPGDWAVVYVQCMNDEGLANYEVRDFNLF